MSKITKTPLQALNNTFRRMPVVADDINVFVKHLSEYIGNINEKEGEEFAKGQLTQFLYDTFYHNKNKINTKGRIDLAIYEDKTPIVIIECKRPKPNDPDMITSSNLNAKAFHELILYYLRERIEHNNTNIKNLIATNMYEWFVFDERDFDKIIFGNAALKKDYETFVRENKNTDHFYKSIAKIFLEKEKPHFEFTHFDLRTYKKLLSSPSKAKTDEEKENRGKLRALYKFLSPQHLLKQQLENDSNSLNKDFYYELLHIIGLEEVKDGGKKIIQRKPQGKRDEGSLLENVIFNIEQTERLRKLQNPSSFGETSSEQLFSVALELCISWVDRILFLKLLEQQLVRYHKNNEYLFLNIKKIPDFDALKHVFFSVLAKKTDDRQGKWKTVFEKTPYLNSSLFEPNSLEDDVIGIESLDSRLELQIFKGTKILVGNKPAKGNIPTLEYLFKFLDAYNFASEGADEEQEDRKALINAAVLGLIFEKINGYKDGSFFTPGFITMYMCRETLRKTVLDKFNEKYKWNCEAIEDLYNHLKRNTKDILEYNELINDLKICDPAVGSGHFLVSALNELIAIKSELGILADYAGKTLPVKVTVENDELMVIYGEEIYEYSTPTSKSSESEIQRIQKALFHQKELIIEHCLFGVDINGNSVKICRLRLWIELLKNAYYTKESNYQELETLPNIDINIKRGNSLMSRFTLNSDLSTVFKQQKFNYNTYRLAVESYKTAPSKKAKQELLIFINEIKEQFKTVFYSNDPLQKKLNLFQGQRLLLNQDMDLFGKKIRNEKEVKTEKKRLDMLIAQTEQRIKDIKANKIYRNAFEWRFEFPEVMDKNGNFIGFDVIIGNPPYIRQEEIKDLKPILQEKFKVFNSLADILTYFFELGNEILKPKGNLSFIVSNKFFKASYGKQLKQYILDNTQIQRIIEFDKVNVFEEATVKSAIIEFSKIKNDKTIQYVDVRNTGITDLENELLQFGISVHQSTLTAEQWSFENKSNSGISDKIFKKGTPLKDWNIEIYRGVLTGYNEAFLISEEERDIFIKLDPAYTSIIKPLYRGREIQKYFAEFQHSYIIYIPWHFPLNNDSSIQGASKIAEKEFERKFPDLFSHFKQHKKSLMDRNKAETGIRYEWYAMQRFGSNYWKEFQKPKLIWKRIGSQIRFCYDETGTYTLDSTCIATGDHLKYLVAILNSKLILKELNRFAPKTGTGDLIISVQALEPLKIPIPTKAEEKAFENIVDKILDLKKSDPKANTTALEKQIDSLVYKLYDLTVKEIELIENHEL